MRATSLKSAILKSVLTRRVCMSVLISSDRFRRRAPTSAAREVEKQNTKKRKENSQTLQTRGESLCEHRRGELLAQERRRYLQVQFTNRHTDKQVVVYLPIIVCTYALGRDQVLRERGKVTRCLSTNMKQSCFLTDLHDIGSWRPHTGDRFDFDRQLSFFLDNLQLDDNKVSFLN